MNRQPLSTARAKTLRTFSFAGVVGLASVGALGACQARSPRSVDAQADATTRTTLQRDYNAHLYQGLQAFRVPGIEGGHVVGDNSGPYGLEWTKSTNMAVDLLATLVAERQGLITHGEASGHVRGVLRALAKLRHYRGIFPEFIKLARGAGAEAEVKDGRIHFSSVDSAWVTLALSITQSRYERSQADVAILATQLLLRQDYATFLQSDRLLGGFRVDASSDEVVELSNFAYSDRNSEARPLVLSLVGLSKVPEAVWENMSYSWTTHSGVLLATNWHGSAFVEMSGQLFFDEMRLAPRSLGRSHLNYLEATTRVARARGHVIWGYAPSCAPPDGYAEYGLDRPAVVSPYAPAQLATTDDPRALANLSMVLQALSWDGTPVSDALDPVSKRSLCRAQRVFDQALLFLALNAEALRQLASKASWYAGAGARLSRMDTTHLPPAAPGSP